VEKGNHPFRPLSGKKAHEEKNCFREEGKSGLVTANKRALMSGKAKRGGRRKRKERGERRGSYARRKQREEETYRIVSHSWGKGAAEKKRILAGERRRGEFSMREGGGKNLTLFLSERESV